IQPTVDSARGIYLTGFSPRGIQPTGFNPRGIQPTRDSAHAGFNPLLLRTLLLKKPKKHMINPQEF
ncbi:hypothetical protein SMA66_24785, partial [Escherichia coli]|uniref:hypothetical protein n=1 Tax=Escherichia coli TaxID=562 RepID=UPI00307AF8E0